MRTVLKFLLLIVSVTMIESTIAFAQSHSTSAEILAVEKSRTVALEQSDLNTVDKLLGDDLTYVHATGKIDNKTSYLDALRSGDLRYLSWEPKELHARSFGETAVVTGKYHVKAIDQRVQGQPLDVQIIFLSVYAKRAGHWQQVAWQSTGEQPPRSR